MSSINLNVIFRYHPTSQQLKENRSSSENSAIDITHLFGILQRRILLLNNSSLPFYDSQKFFVENRSIFFRTSAPTDRCRSEIMCVTMHFYLNLLQTISDILATGTRNF